MTKIILAYELLGEGVSKSYIAKRLGVSRRTIIRWSKAIEEHGSLDAFLAYYQQAKKGSRQKRKIDAILKRCIWALREKHHQCCGQMIQYFLQKEYEMQVSVTTIYKVLSEKYQLRSKWRISMRKAISIVIFAVNRNGVSIVEAMTVEISSRTERALKSDRMSSSTDQRIGD